MSTTHPAAPKQKLGFNFDLQCTSSGPAQKTPERIREIGAALLNMRNRQAQPTTAPHQTTLWGAQTNSPLTRDLVGWGSSAAWRAASRSPSNFRSSDKSFNACACAVEASHAPVPSGKPWGGRSEKVPT